MATLNVDAAVDKAIESTMSDAQVENATEPEVGEGEEGVGAGTEGAGTAPEAGAGAESIRDGRAAPETRGKKGVGPGKQEVVGKGDLVDSRTGKVIAKAGKERQFYEAASRANGTLQQVVGQNKQLMERVSAYESAFTHLKNAGIEPNEVQAAISIYTKFKNDPAETIKDLLTVARQMGKNVDLGEGGAVDMAAIKGMISEAMAPITNAQRQRQREGALRARAEGAIREFFSKHPDAGVQVDAINLVLKKEPQLGLDGAYWKVKSLVNARGLDWNRPIVEQLRSGNGAGERRPLSTGRSSEGAARVRGSAKPNGRDATTADIVREALAEAGVTVP